MQDFHYWRGQWRIPPLAKNLFIPHPPGKILPPMRPPPPSLLNNNFSVVVAPIPFFFNFMLFYTQIMLILIVIHVQYLRNVAFFFETASNGQSHFSADSHNSMKKSLQKNFSSLHQEENFPTYPFNAIWKTLVCFTFLS